MQPRPATSPLQVVSADTLEGERVLDANGQPLGTIEDLMIDVQRGAIDCALVACTLEGRDRLVAVPWSALRRDAERGCFLLDADRDQLAGDERFTYR